MTTDSMISDDRKVELDSGPGPRRVILESPYAGEIEANVAYARAAMFDCLERGESPFASHLLYTQVGVLDDSDATQRQRGIDAGLAWGTEAHATVVYTDRGISRGMRYGIDRAEREGRPVEYRSLYAATVRRTSPHPSPEVAGELPGYDQGRRDVLNAILALNPTVAAKLAKLNDRDPDPEGRLPFDVVLWVSEVAAQLGIEPKDDLIPASPAMGGR